MWGMLCIYIYTHCLACFHVEKEGRLLWRRDEIHKIWRSNLEEITCQSIEERSIREDEVRWDYFTEYQCSPWWMDGDLKGKGDDKWMKEHGDGKRAEDKWDRVWETTIRRKKVGSLAVWAALRQSLKDDGVVFSVKEVCHLKYHVYISNNIIYVCIYRLVRVWESVEGHATRERLVFIISFSVKSYFDVSGGHSQFP